jgi:hypothetical protein
MKTLNLRKLTRIHWSLLGLAVLGAAFLLTTQPARRFVRHQVAALRAALLPQAQTGQIIIGPSAQIVRVPAPPCSKDLHDEVRAVVRDHRDGATNSTPSVRIDEGRCTLTLRSSDVITKRLIFEGASASGVTVECNGATIEHPNPAEGSYNVVIRSRKLQDSATGGLWERPENVTLRNCKIKGAVFIAGMDDPELLDSSRQQGHAERARNAAPRNIVFD